MIRVVARADGMSAQIMVTGHAGYAEAGKDIVCAGVSVLTNALANLMRGWEEAGLIDLIQIYPAEAPHHLFCTTGGNPAINAAIRTILSEYAQIAEQFPENLQLTILDDEEEGNT